MHIFVNLVGEVAGQTGIGGGPISTEEWFADQFPVSPATVVFEEWEMYHLWIAAEVHWRQEVDDSEHLVLQGFGEEKWFPLHELHQSSLSSWRGRVGNAREIGTTVTVRPTVEDDAPRSVTMAGMTQIPMPLTVLRALHAAGEFQQPELLAVVLPDSTVSDVLLWSEVGMFVRDNGKWTELYDCAATADLRLETISAEGLVAFDSAGAGDARLRLGALGWVAP